MYNGASCEVEKINFFSFFFLSLCLRRVEDKSERKRKKNEREIKKEREKEERIESKEKEKV